MTDSTDSPPSPNPSSGTSAEENAAEGNVATDTSDDNAPPIREADEIARRSVWAQEVIADVPHAFIRVGNLTILAVVLVTLVLAWFVQYPETIEAPVVFTTERAPVRVIAPSSGRVDQLFASERQTVAAGEPLIVMESSASYDDVQRVAAWTEDVQGAMHRGQSWIDLQTLPNVQQLGTIQDPYLQLKKRLSDFQSFAANPFRMRRETAMQQQISNLDSLIRSQKEQTQIADRERALLQRDVDRRVKLASDDLVSEENVEQAQRTLLSAGTREKEQESAMARTRVQRGDLQLKLISLRQERDDQQRTFRLMLDDAFRRLRIQLRKWRQSNVIQTPLNGRVTFPDIVQEGHFVEAGRPLGAVIPPSSARVGELMLPTGKVGGIEEGQRVKVSFDKPAPSEVGYVFGTINRISLAHDGENYLVRVALPNGLTTEFGHDIEFWQEMSAQATIITRKKRLLVRVFDWLRYVVSDTTSDSS